MPDRRLLRQSATILFIGVLGTLVVGVFHPDKAPANDHAAAFAGYAASGSWTAVHLGQFAGMGVIIAGLLTLYRALNSPGGAAGWGARLGALSALLALGLYAVLQAIDGVALKHAVDAWVAAPEAEKSARFASAETVRWLEWGARSYQSFVLGATFLLFAAELTRVRTALRFVGYPMGLSGVGYIAQGWIIGVSGFSQANAIPTLATIALTLVWTIWLLIGSWRMDQAAP